MVMIFEDKDYDGRNLRLTSSVPDLGRQLEQQTVVRSRSQLIRVVCGVVPRCAQLRHNETAEMPRTTAERGIHVAVSSCFMRVLIADDDSGTRLVLASALKALGMDISVASDGCAAWELLKEGTGPSLALVDWEMPGIDGLELCHRIRRHSPPMQMYLILLTGRDSREDVIAGLNAGADDYIIKPFDPEELRARVQVGMRVVSLQNRLAARIAELQEARDQLTLQANTDALTGLVFPARLARVGHDRSGPCAPLRSARRGADDRPRFFQARERHARPQRRRRCPQRVRRGAAAGGARLRRRGTTGRRRICDSAAADLREGSGARRQPTRGALAAAPRCRRSPVGSSCPAASGSAKRRRPTRESRMC